MSQDLDTLTSDTGLSQLAHISIDERPHVTLDDHSLSGSNAGMAKVRKGVKDYPAE